MKEEPNGEAAQYVMASDLLRGADGQDGSPPPTNGHPGANGTNGMDGTDGGERGWFAGYGGAYRPRMAPPENGVTEGMVTTDMPDGKPIPAVATPEWVAALYAATPAYSLPAAVPAAPPTTLPPGGMPNAMPSPLGPAAYPSPYSYSGMCPVPGSGYPY